MDGLWVQVENSNAVIEDENVKKLTGEPAGLIVRRIKIDTAALRHVDGWDVP